MTPEKAIYIADYCLDNTQVREALKDMARQVEELKTDADRYQWLRNGDYPFSFAQRVLNNTPFGIDAAIDAARKAK